MLFLLWFTFLVLSFILSNRNVHQNQFMAYHYFYYNFVFILWNHVYLCCIMLIQDCQRCLSYSLSFFIILMFVIVMDLVMRNMSLVVSDFYILFVVTTQVLSYVATLKYSPINLP